MRQLGSRLVVSDLGFGAMGLSGAYGIAYDTASIRVLHRALELGITFFDTANTYGDGHNEQLLGRALAGRRDRAVIATKFGGGLDTGLGRPDKIPGFLEDSLRRLGTDHVDLYYLHRVDPTTPVEDTVGAMATLVQSGKVLYVGLSEASAATIRRAHQVHPITAVQTEYSLIQRHIEAEILPVLTQLGIGLVAYSPLGRGLLGGQIRQSADLASDDGRGGLPRFQGANLQANLQLVHRLEPIASGAGVTLAQLSLAWVLSRNASVVPIPGTRHLSRLEENVRAAELPLGADTLRLVSVAVDPGDVAGDRYPADRMSRLEI